LQHELLQQWLYSLIVIIKWPDAVQPKMNRSNPGKKLTAFFLAPTITLHSDPQQSFNYLHHITEQNEK